VTAFPAFPKPEPRPKKPRKPLQRKRMKRGPSRRACCVRRHADQRLLRPPARAHLAPAPDGEAGGPAPRRRARRDRRLGGGRPERAGHRALRPRPRRVPAHGLCHAAPGWADGGPRTSRSKASGSRASWVCGTCRTCSTSWEGELCATCVLCLTHVASKRSDLGIPPMGWSDLGAATEGSVQFGGTYGPPVPEGDVEGAEGLKPRCRCGLRLPCNDCVTAESAASRRVPWV